MFPYYLRSTFRNVLFRVRAQNRTYKNFGHKRQPEATITVLWHGFLTFTFIGLGLNWKSFNRLFFGIEVDEDMKTPVDK